MKKDKNIIKFDKLLRDWMKSHIEPINKNNTKCLVMPGDRFYVPSATLQPSSFVKLDSWYDRYKELDIKSVGSIKDYPYECEIWKKRVLLGYVAVSRVSAGSTTIESLMKPLLLQTLEELKINKGYGPEEITAGEYYLTLLEFPDNQLVKDLENSAAYEINFYSNCVQYNPIVKPILIKKSSGESK